MAVWPTAPFAPSPPPTQADLERSLDGVTAAWIVGEDQRRVRVGRSALGPLRQLLRIRDGARAGLGASARPVTLVFERACRPSGALRIDGDCSVQLLSWSDAVDVEEPAALAAWLAAHGAGEPLRALSRSRAPDAALALSAWRAAAPPEVGPHVDALSPGGRAVLDAERLDAALSAVRAARGGVAEAAWALGAWHGARRGPWDEAYAFEAVTDAMLRRLGIHEVFEAALAGVPAASVAGIARFLVEHITWRARWGIEQRMPLLAREALLAAARDSGAQENAVRARRLLFGEGDLAPPGTELVAASSGGRFNRLCTDGVHAFGVDGHELMRLTRGRGATALTQLVAPGSPLAARAGSLFFLKRSGAHRVSVEGGEVRSGAGPLFHLAPGRLRRALSRFVAARDAALARLVPSDADLLPLDPGHDACDAYEAFGGALPAALRLRSFWGCDAARGLLHEAPARGAARTIALGGRPAWLGATDTGVLAVVAREAGEAAVLAVDEGGPARLLGVFRGSAGDVLAALRVGSGAWLRLAAPLGDVVVALAGAAEGDRAPLAT
ncbi:hypothetical protein WME79_28590 [Sorangium sp. So ce726]|uniref:hypothetical protein n=1 Tax=Sorangium sp. So ce726 TaxID=3133319 RepID=UPI003F5F466F